ncbi:MAG TPA: Nramp family divalent metal transporter [Nitrosarchaeum sp.]|jgi:manganese transport protein|nr:Nramp family divalent metal transporter [Nitrosarchaeum sp.]
MSKEYSAMTTRQRMFYFIRFSGLGLVVGVAYIDPGNWGTDIAAGSKFGYSLLWVVVMSNVIGMFMQYLSSKLGIITGFSLAENCRDNLSKSKSFFLWITAEIAIIATDLAEVVGAAIAFNLLFGIPLIYGAIITGLDTLLILALERVGIRKVESIIVGMMVLIASIYLLEIYLASPDASQIAYHAIVPELQSGSVVIAVGILGATVMPHAIFLHSAMMRTRKNMHQILKYPKRIIKFATIDTIFALSVAGLINGAILVMSAATFHQNNMIIDSIEAAYETLTPLLGNVSSTAFGIALLASGLASSVVATLSGQIIFEGFTKFKAKLWQRKIVIRTITIIPAIIAIYYGVNTLDILVISQVILSLQLPFTIIPLVYFTSKEKIMGKEYVNRTHTKIIAIIAVSIIIVLNVLLLNYMFG